MPTGTLVNSQITRLSARIPDASMASLQQQGLEFHQAISVPVKGESFLRLGVHDKTADRVGSLELPIAAAQKLQAFATTTP